MSVVKSQGLTIKSELCFLKPFSIKKTLNFWMMLGFLCCELTPANEITDHCWPTQAAVWTLWQWKTIALHSFQVDLKSGTLKNHLRSCVWHYLLSLSSSLLANSLVLWAKRAFCAREAFSPTSSCSALICLWAPLLNWSSAEGFPV